MNKDSEAYKLAVEGYKIYKIYGDKRAREYLNTKLVNKVLFEQVVVANTYRMLKQGE